MWTVLEYILWDVDKSVYYILCNGMFCNYLLVFWSIMKFSFYNPDFFIFCCTTFLDSIKVNHYYCIWTSLFFNVQYFLLNDNGCTNIINNLKYKIHFKYLALEEKNGRLKTMICPSKKISLDKCGLGDSSWKVIKLNNQSMETFNPAFSCLDP